MHQLAGCERPDVRDRQVRRTGPQLDLGHDLLAQPGVRYADHLDIAHIGVGMQALLDLPRCDAFAASDEHVLQPTGDSIAARSPECIQPAASSTSAVLSSCSQ